MQIYKQNDIIIESFPVGMLSCNASLIYSEKTKEAIIVDPGDSLQDILIPIKKRGLIPKILIHTHAHFDHISCSEELKGETMAPLALHQDDRELYLNLPMQGKLFGFTFHAPNEADIYFEHQDHFSLNPADFGAYNGQMGVKVIHTAGHTRGSSCFLIDLFSPPILLSGDTLFQESIGRTDLPGGDYPAIIKSIKTRLLTLPDETIVIPGHGDITTIGHEKKFNSFLK